MRVLIVDDEPSIRKITGLAVESMGHEVVTAPNGARALKELETESCDACFLDVNLGTEDGLVVLEKLLKAQPGLVVIMFTAYASIAVAVEAMRRGAFDFIPKPFTPDQIRQVLDKVGRTRKLEQKVKQLESQITEETPGLDLTSAEPAMQKLLQIAFKAAETPATVLILGPSGTGKSVLAREVHRRSTQKENAFITVNCPSLSRELLESELFGHVKGSFTGAVNDTMGKVAAADGGTLFLDEIGELPLEIQPKLLRLLQEREYERVGEPKIRKANVRVIAATNRNLAEEVKAGRFREDLYYRLNVINVTLPGLKDRPGDLMRLAENYRVFFCGRMGKRVAEFSPAVKEAFVRYGWPGNLRELRNVIERAVILSSGELIEPADLPEEFSHQADSSIAVGARVTLDALETEHIRRVLASAKNLDEAAKTLGIDPATLYRKRQKLGLI
ncbi:sigma-54-dependent Fis family transcriptional regulator [Nibricoccus aquaticus]|uniref:Sigma-54-dependent Fis family transcriptional regulator n=1 Tax=Nibricoccus aquaticus TaxID=2576891 RepID=A0A290QC30_9BACT|nr:sigma-54 dependent transcriptional regulator [Nibricoccus aquaticus]ATC66084.1 sigma-54-dependent Fis family transcriptional regulator [Nibricoccus aquaticus]